MSHKTEARSALYAEWASRAPKTRAEIAAFYKESAHISGDLDLWHEEPGRQKYTETIVHVAGQIEAKLAVDIGCGAGHDLRALKAAGIPELVGVEPNDASRTKLSTEFSVVPDVDMAPIENADLLVLIDVLEHVVDPEAFMTKIATRARAGGQHPGAVLIETCSNWDIATPLHLAANRGWHPGRALEQAGFVLLDVRGNLRVWQRANAVKTERTTMILCAYRAISVRTFQSIKSLSGITTIVEDEKGRRRFLGAVETPWRVMVKTDDGLVSRARSSVVSEWWRATADDVFLMVDDDIVFSPEDAELIVKSVRETRGIVCGAYAIRDGGSVAIRPLKDTVIEFKKGAPRAEIMYASTGFFGVHRDVIDAMVPTLTLCHEDAPFSFWPMFQTSIVPMGQAQGYLSEDWAFCQRAIDLGFKVYVEPSIILGHLAQIEMTVHNMDRIAAAIGTK